MRRVLVGALLASAGFMGATAPPASACDPNRPTCYGVEYWLSSQLHRVDCYVVEPTQQRVDEIVGAIDLGCPPSC